MNSCLSKERQEIDVMATSQELLDVDPSKGMYRVLQIPENGPLGTWLALGVVQKSTCDRLAAFGR